MFHPTLHDDGSTVTLDLHGATVDEALDLAVRVVAEASRRGRAQVKLVHGASTSDRPGRTIKRALRDQIEAGGFDRWTGGAWYAEGHLILSLDVTAASDARPIRLREML